MNGLLLVVQARPDSKILSKRVLGLGLFFCLQGLHDEDIRMKICKVINNNVLSAFDEKEQELILMGRGIGFKAKPGDTIDESRIEKRYHIENSELSRRFQEMLSDMPMEHMEISSEIINYAKDVCGMKLNQSIYVALTDHINFAIERYRNGIQLPNALLGEIEELYHREYMVGEYARRILAERLNLHFAKDEAGFIALHFVNAALDIPTEDVHATMDALSHSIAIVKEAFGEQVDERSMHYERFVVHLKFLVRRMESRELLQDEEPDIAAEINHRYAKEAMCSQKISDYIKERYKVELTEEERMYLTVYIRRITNKNNE